MWFILGQRIKNMTTDLPQTDPASVPALKLVNGQLMPQVGLGTWKSEKGKVALAVEAALRCGYRHIDCAKIYGNEQEVGEGIAKAGVARGDIFITSKLWNDSHKPEDVEPSCRKTMQDLGVEYLDLYLIHWPVCLKKDAPLPPGKDDFCDVPIADTWREMEKLVQKGLVRAIGVSNFNVERMKEIFSIQTVPCCVNQIEAHVWLQQNTLKKLCEENNCLITAYSPLGSPDRPPRSRDDSDPVLMEDESLLKIAEAENRSVASVLIRFAVQRNTIVIPKSITPSRIAENLTSAITPLSENNFNSLLSMDRNLRLLKGTLWLPEGTCGPLKTLEDIWGSDK